MLLWLFPAAVTCRFKKRLSSASMPCSCNKSSIRASAAPSNTACTQNPSVPERTIPAEARAPRTIPNASIKMDLPAPVSPVNTLSPGVKATFASSIKAKLCTCKDCNIISISLPSTFTLLLIFSNSNSALALAMILPRCQRPAFLPGRACPPGCVKGSVVCSRPK